MSRADYARFDSWKGSVGAVDIDKFRQLLDYVQAEALEGRDHKAILIGDGYRLTAPEAPERQNQFTEKALLGANRFGFCLLPTTELFKAVCAVLKAVGNEGLKIAVRRSILSTAGVWAFAREVAVPQESGAGASSEPAAAASEDRSTTRGGAV